MCQSLGFLATDGRTAKGCVGDCPGLCGNTARTFPEAFRIFVGRKTSMESASITESPCHKRACPAYRPLPVLEFARKVSAERFAGIAASCGLLPFDGKSVERT